jgi:carboxyl-terminal processing protease
MKSIGFILGVLILFCVGFAWRDVQNGKVPDAKAFQSLVGIKTPARQSPEQEFKQTYNRIQASYFRTVKPIELKYAGISGMMASLGDPHTMFLTPQIAKRFQTDVKANYVGIGARLSPYSIAGKNLGAKAVVVFETGPGHAAGLRRGDVIVGVSGKSIAGLDIEEIVEKIMGEEGTTVKLSVLKNGKGTKVVIPVRRSHVVTPTVESQYLQTYKVGYILIASFSAPTAEQFDRELEKMERNPMRGLVIDVRGNPGGYLETAVELLSRFKPDKVVVTMKMRDGSVNREYTSGGVEHNFTYPVVILINEDSASASEIFAGALRDYKMATLVGTHTYGKASVQEVYDFKDGSSGKITIARYFLPSGADIGRKVDEDGTYISGGLEPDVKVEVADVLPRELLQPNLPDSGDLADPVADNQLKRAIEVALSKSG